jgi:hypothetical protein
MTEEVKVANKQETIKSIRNDAVRLLELLNILIPKLETYNPKVSSELISAVSDKCFELGANVATNKYDIAEDKTEDDNDVWPAWGAGGC